MITFVLLILLVGNIDKGSRPELHKDPEKPHRTNIAPVVVYCLSTVWA